MEKEKYDIAVLGAGPAGYALAIRASQNGAKAVLFEKTMSGGTCLNLGCIPTKSILHNTNLLNSTKNLTKFGVKTDFSEFAWAKVVDIKDNTVEKIVKSLEKLILSYGIEVVKGEAKILGEGQVEANGKVFECKNIVIATGSKPSELKNLPVDNKFIFNSDGILSLKTLPKSVAIIGSGAIGVEWARIFSDLGTEVTLIEAMDRILPIADSDVSARLERLLKKKRVKIEKSALALSAQNGKIELNNGKVIEVEAVLAAAGRSAVLPESIPEIKTDKGFIKVDNNFMTNIKGVYAIGDVNGISMLAHSATHQAIELAEYLSGGKEVKFDKNAVPSVIYGAPEAAWFGESEDELVASGAPFRKFSLPISALGKAHTDEEIDGFIKIIVGQDEKILSASIVAPEASALLMQLLIAKENNLPYTAVTKAIFPHPTFSEGVFEALLGLDNKSLSMPKVE